MQVNFQRLGALVRKETLQILRDRRFIMLFLGLTFVQLFVYSYSASRTVYHLPLARGGPEPRCNQPFFCAGAYQFPIFR